ncbi:MAG: DUF6174 domain-containing protein, partial [Gemmatimonadota bacterium]
ALASLSACSVNPFALSQEAAGDHRARWSTSGIVDYEYVLDRACECTRETTRTMRVEVRGGSVTGATYRDTGESAAMANGYPTVEDLFDLIDDAIQRRAAGLTVAYDAALGYPTEITIDYDLEVADDEITINASNLVPM